MMIKVAILLAFYGIIGETAQGCVQDSPSFYGCAGHLIGVDDMQSVQLSFSFDNPTGKKCPNCLDHKPPESFSKCLSKKDGLSTYCKDCDSLLRKQRYYANQERELDGAARRREGNKEYRSEYNKAQWANPEKRKELQRQCKEYRQNNKAKIREIGRNWRQANPEKMRTMNRVKAQKYRAEHWDKWYQHIVKYRKKHPEKIRQGNRRAFHRRHANGGSYTGQQWKTLCQLFNNTCACCHEAKKLTVDHIIPVSEGGTSFIDNLQPLCGSCNSKKHAKAIDYRTKAVAEWAESEMTGWRQAA